MRGAYFIVLALLVCAVHVSTASNMMKTKTIMILAARMAQVLVLCSEVCDAQVYQSCQHALAQGVNSSGVVTIDPDGGGSEPAFPAWCNQADQGGGWMLAATRGSRTTGQHNDVPASTVETR